MICLHKIMCNYVIKLIEHWLSAGCCTACAFKAKHKCLSHCFQSGPLFLNEPSAACAMVRRVTSSSNVSAAANSLDDKWYFIFIVYIVIWFLEVVHVSLLVISTPFVVCVMFEFVVARCSRIGSNDFLHFKHSSG